MVPAVTATGLENVACCQPDADSFENVACAMRVPPVVHRLPMWVPAFAAAL